MVRNESYTEDVDPTDSKYDRKSIRRATVSPGDTVRVGIRTSRTADPVAVTGVVETKYNDDKFAIQVDGTVPNGTTVIVSAGFDDDSVRVGNFADGFDGVGHAVFVQFPDE